MSKHDHLIEASALLDKTFTETLYPQTHPHPNHRPPKTDTEILAHTLSLTIRALRDHITQDHD